MSVYKRMTEWTSLSVTEEQKQKIQSAQKDAGHDGAIGRFIVQQVNSGKSNETADDVARKVVERLEGSKPLAEMEFEDWFEPNYAQTIANNIEAELMLSDEYADELVRKVTNDLEATLPKKIAEELR